MWQLIRKGLQFNAWPTPLFSPCSLLLATCTSLESSLSLPEFFSYSIQGSLGKIRTMIDQTRELNINSTKQALTIIPINHKPLLTYCLAMFILHSLPIAKHSTITSLLVALVLRPTYILPTLPTIRIISRLFQKHIHAHSRIQVASQARFYYSHVTTHI